MNLLCSWIDTVTLLRKFNNDILVSVWVGPDGKNSDDFIVQFDQSDLLLPSIDYYKLGANHPIIKVQGDHSPWRKPPFNIDLKLRFSIRTFY